MEKKKNLQSVPVIAKLFDISDRHVQRLAAGGVLPYESQRPYKFDLLPTIRAYIRYLRNRIDEHEKDERFEQAEYDKLRADADLKQHQAAIFRMKVRRMESQYHDAEVVKDCYNDFKLTIQEKIEQLARVEPEPDAAQKSGGDLDLRPARGIAARGFRRIPERDGAKPPFAGRRHVVLSAPPCVRSKMNHASPERTESRVARLVARTDDEQSQSPLDGFARLDPVEVGVRSESRVQRPDPRGRAEPDADRRGEDVCRVRAAVLPVRRRAAGAEEDGEKEEETAERRPRETAEAEATGGRGCGGVHGATGTGGGAVKRRSRSPGASE